MKLNKTLILAGTALAGLAATSAVYAQSTATQDVESKTQEVVVKGVRSTGPIKRESGPKARSTIDQGTISKNSAGQTIADSLNMIPGYNFTNNDAYGSAGGNVMMRGLDGSRISLTFDGMQLNDSGNYAIFTNQQLEPELICSASVATGATDVDSMTASATGGTINYSTCKPEDTMGGVVKLSMGSDNFKNVYARFDTGRFGPFGTRLFLAVTDQSYDTWTREIAYPAGVDAVLKKRQYNARIYQDIGDNGSFMSVAFHWNENRNASIFGNPKSFFDTNGFDANSALPSNINPSNTGNIRGQSKWVINDKLTITVDPQFQFVMANGGGNTRLSEQDARFCGASYVAGCGIDLNGDGDHLDTSTSSTVSPTQAPLLYHPSNTNTHRYGLNTAVIYKLNDDHMLRFGYSIDRARHRQTGEATKLDANGVPLDVFGGKYDASLRIQTLDGSFYQRRNRLSFANVDVMSFEYRGHFLGDVLMVDIGLRDQKMERILNQRCYSPVGGTGATSPYCTTQTVASSVTMADGNKVVSFAQTPANTTAYFAPYTMKVAFKKTLPNIGLTVNLNQANQMFFTYAESMSSPRTDSYYAVIFDDITATSPSVTSANLTTTSAAYVAANKMSVANPEPETSTNIELGYRFRTATLQATATVFSARDENRIVSSFDQDSGAFFDRNIGAVKRRGFEASGAYRAPDNIVINGSLTYTDTEMQNNLQYAKTGGVARFLMTKGKSLVEMPKWMYTVGVDFNITPRLSANVNAKYVGDRFTTDINDEVAPHFMVANASLRYDLAFLKPGTYLQLNAINIGDEKYYGSISSQNNALPYVDNLGQTKPGSGPNLTVGAPQTFILSLRAQF